jgi:hypothetical protein
MSARMTLADGASTIAELQEFASFPPAAQRYVRRSLDIAFDRADAVAIWSRDEEETASIEAQTRLYGRLPALRALVLEDVDVRKIEGFLGSVITLSAFDLGQDRLHAFGPYRFLYERLLGAQVRPWLPAAFCAAASLPQLHPARRRVLLQSISEAAATAPAWSSREPGFFPEWIETTS